jgi:hypothetical protein
VLPYRILWHDMFRDTLSEASFATVTEATAHAQRIQRAYIHRPAPGFDIAWAGTGRVLPDWYRQSCLNLGH